MEPEAVSSRRVVELLLHCQHVLVQLGDDRSAFLKKKHFNARQSRRDQATPASAVVRQGGRCAPVDRGHHTWWRGHLPVARATQAHSPPVHARGLGSVAQARRGRRARHSRGAVSIARFSARS
eukprot:Lithocolla_globosa_v1_NODE_6_length_11976_cov_15.425432.p15 type:complete len:123 gc:universal NODE_6_length_11976_cov_15.425432:9375-9743(+)